MFYSSEIKALTGVRGAAAFYVVLYHYLALNTGLPAAVLRHGYLSVDLFFVLSGFVMGMTYGGDFAAGYRAAAHGRFLLKRLGRVYPAYAAVTAACVLLGWLGALPGVAMDGRALAANLLLVQAWGVSDSVVAPAWSISTELAAYLLFPAFAALVLSRGWRIAWAAGLAAVALLVLVATRSGAEINQTIGGAWARKGPLDVHDGATLFPMLRCFAGFLLGLFGWRCLGVAGVRRLARQAALRWASLGVVAALLAVPRSDVIEVVLFVPLVVGLAAAPSGPARLFAWRPVYGLGAISYSLYLVHAPLQQLAAPWAAALSDRVSHGYLLAGAALLAPALLLAVVCFRLIERPGRAWSRRAIGRAAITGASAPVAEPLRDGYPSADVLATRTTDSQPAIAPSPPAAKRRPDRSHPHLAGRERAPAGDRGAAARP